MKQSLLLELGADNPAQSAILAEFRHLRLKVLLSCAAERCSDPPPRMFSGQRKHLLLKVSGVYVFNA